jgi:hypothetical protein
MLTGKFLDVLPEIYWYVQVEAVFLGHSYLVITDSLGSYVQQ